MRIRNTAMQLVFFSAASVVVGLILLNRSGGVAVALSAAASTNFFSLPAQTMHPTDSTIKYDASDGYLKTVQSSSMTGNPTAYLGQVHLPDGAKIIGVRCFGWDSDPMFEFSCRLSRFSSLTSPVENPVTSLASSGNQPGKVTVNGTVLAGMDVVDNSNYSYAIHLNLPPPYNPPYQDLWVSRCVVDTTQTVYLPALAKD